MPLELWVLGATIAVIGVLVSVCGAGASEWDFAFKIVGVAIVGVGSWVCITKFRQWVSSI